MSWQVLKLNTFWTAEEADTALALIDELRDQIVATYGEQIIAMRTAELDKDEGQTELPLDGSDF